ncbi:MAG: hypothetical protein AB1608_00860 [Thermoproteota archaeon]
MDKYLFIILILLIAGMAFSIFKNPPSIELFYAQLAGAFVIIAYSTFRNRQKRKNEKNKR